MSSEIQLLLYYYTIYSIQILFTIKINNNLYSVTVYYGFFLCLTLSAVFANQTHISNLELQSAQNQNMNRNQNHSSLATTEIADPAFLSAFAAGNCAAYKTSNARHAQTK